MLLRLESSLASERGGGAGAEGRTPPTPTPSSGLLPPDTDLHFSPPDVPLLNDPLPRLDFDRPLCKTHNKKKYIFYKCIPLYIALVTTSFTLVITLDFINTQIDLSNV